jgi:hypothetical protein
MRECELSLSKLLGVPFDKLRAHGGQAQGASWTSSGRMARR